MRKANVETPKEWPNSNPPNKKVGNVTNNLNRRHAQYLSSQSDVYQWSADNLSKDIYRQNDTFRQSDTYRQSVICRKNGIRPSTDATPLIACREKEKSSVIKNQVCSNRKWNVTPLLGHFGGRVGICSSL